jgi:hypothetical protein
MDDREGEVPMKKLVAFLAMVSLLSLMPAAFAADSDVSVPRPGESSVVSHEAKDVSRDQASNTPRSEDEIYHAGDLRQPGLYMGPDGVYHNVPKIQDARQRIY